MGDKEMVATLDKVKKGDTLKFTKYEEVPESGIILDSGAICEVKSIEKDAQGLTFTVIADNPNFNPKAKETTKNPKHAEVELFDTEVEAVAPAKKTAAKKTTAAKKPVKTTTSPMSKQGKATAKAKTTAKVKPATKAAPKAKAAPKTENKEVSETVYEPEWGKLKTEDAEVLAIVEEQGEELIDYTKNVLAQRGNASYQLGGLLYHVQLTGDFQKLSPNYQGGKGFMEFVNTELAFDYRSAKYLIDIYTGFNHYNLGHKVNEIGWTKCKEILKAMSLFSKNNDGKLLTKTAVNKLITKAGKTTVKGLEESISDEYKTDTPDKVKFRKVSFSLPEERATIVEDIIKRAMEYFGADSMGVAIESVLTDWATEMLD